MASVSESVMAKDPQSSESTTDDKKPVAQSDSTASAPETAEPSQPVVDTTGCDAAAKPEDELYPEEEVLEGDWMRPHVDIKEVEVQTGEEDEACFWKHRAKLYRWSKEAGEWKERGLGEAKLLQHKESAKIRFLLRQEKTLKIVANHYVVQHGSFCQLTPNVGSDKIWVWSVVDFSDDGSKLEQFGLKFGQVEAATEFKNKFEEAAKLNEGPFKTFLERAKTTQDDKVSPQ